MDLAVLNTLNLESGLESDRVIFDLYSRSDAYLAYLYVLHIARGATSLYCQMVFHKIL